jgi:hypothetical protein
MLAPGIAAKLSPVFLCLALIQSMPLLLGFSREGFVLVFIS